MSEEVSNADMEAGFAAVFSGEQPVAQESKPEPATEQKPEAKPEAKAEESKPANTGFDPEKEIRRLHGTIGELNSRILALTPKQAPEKSEAVKVQMKRLKDDYPDLAEKIEADMEELLAGQSKQIDTEAISQLISKAVSERMTTVGDELVELVNLKNPTWRNDLWGDGKQGEKRTPEYQRWLNTLPPDEAFKFEDSKSPAYVNQKLSDFYKWKAAEKTKTEKASRLESAITPKGQPRAGLPNVSERDAMMQGFMAAFN